MGRPDLHSTRKPTIAELQSRIGGWGRGASVHETGSTTTGCDSLDALFPGSGVRQGSLVEWLGEGNASGAGTVSLITGRQVCPAERPLILIDTQRELFPLSLSLLGFDLSRLVMIRPASEREALWACEEALRCEAVGLVWANIERLTSTSFRRLQLAAEASSGIGFLVRSTMAISQPSWAEVRLKVHPRPAVRGSPCYQIEAASSYGNSQHTTANVVLDSVKGRLHGNAHSANSLPLVSGMDTATTPCRAAGA